MKYLIFFIVIIFIVYLLYFRNKNIESFSESIGYKPIGCYNDAPNRALPNYFGIVNDADSCSKLAASQGYSYFGLQYPEPNPQCFAGNSLDQAKEYGPTSCGKKGGTWKNYVYSVGKLHGNVVTMGTPGIGPWGNCPGFLDQNAQWIYYQNGQESAPANGSNTWVNPSPPPDSGAVFYYNWFNNTGENISAKVNIIADNASQVWVNSKYKGTQYGGWGGSGGIYNVTLIPGINNFQFRTQNFGSGPNPAGLLVTVVYSSNNQVIFSSNSDWRYIQTTSSTEYTPMNINSNYSLDYSNFCSGQSNGPVYLNSEKSTTINLNSSGNLNDGINKCINDNECQMVLASGENQYNTYKDVQNVFMYCQPQNIPPANLQGYYFLRGAKLIEVGTSNTNTKTIDLPEKDMVVSPIPANPQYYTWPDSFKVRVEGNKLYVIRTDYNAGWGQNLSLYAYSTNNIVIKPQPSDSYIQISSQNIDYYSSDGSVGGTIPVTQANFANSNSQRMNKWINYENLPKDNKYLGKKPFNDDTLSCKDNGYTPVNKDNEKNFQNLGWEFSPFSCNNNNSYDKYNNHRICDTKKNPPKVIPKEIVIPKKKTQQFKKGINCQQPSGVNYFTLSSLSNSGDLSNMQNLLDQNKMIFVSQGSGTTAQVCYVDPKRNLIVNSPFGGSFSGGAQASWGEFDSPSLQSPLGMVDISAGGCPAASGGGVDTACQKAVLKNCGSPAKECHKL